MNKAKCYKKIDSTETSKKNDADFTNPQPPPPPAAATLEEFFQFATGLDYVYIFFGTAGAIASGFCPPAFCLLFGVAIENLNSSSISSVEVFFFLILGIGYWIVLTVATGCWGLTGERQAQIFADKYVSSVLSQEIGWFDSVGANQLATKLADMSGHLRDGMTYKICDFIQFSSQVIGSMIVGLALDPYVALIMFACTPLLGGAATVWVGAISAATKGSSSHYAAAGGLATETLTNIRTVSSLNAQPDIINKYRLYLLDAMNIGISKGLRVGLATGFMWFIVLCTYAITLWYGSQQIADTITYGYTDYPRKQTGGQVYASFFACLIGAFGLGQIAPPVAAITTARVAAKQFLETIARKPLIDGLSNEGKIFEERPVGLVELSDVVFTYPSRSDIEVCKGYNLTIQPGESCALVGASGSGKSTVINLLLRFYDPNSGSVKLDGHDIKDLNVRFLRAQIGYVGQEPVLFSGSIADNIAYGLDVTFAPELSMVNNPGNHSAAEVAEAKEKLRARVVEAAKQANAHDFIDHLPEGYDTDVGSSGSSISGGQKQRIAIARALIKKPVVLLLDEATSALDATSERIVQESIDALQQSKQQTTIIIAHRLNTIRTADKIAVMNGGIIAEEGTHDELLTLNGIYAKLVKLQVEIQTSSEELKVSSSTSSISAMDYQEECNEANAMSNIPTALGSTEMTADDSTTEKEKDKEVLERIWNMIYEHFTWFLLAVLGSVMLGAMFPLWGYILGKSLGVLFLASPSELRINAAKQAGYFLGLAVDAGVGAVLQKYAIAQVGERIVMKLRSDQFQAVVRREIGFFDRKENVVGKLTSRLANDARSVTKATGEATAAQIQALGCLFIGLLLGFISCWKIGLVVLGAMFPMVISDGIKMAAYTGQLDSIIFKNKLHSDEEHDIVSTAFTQMRTVSAFSVQFKIAKMYGDITALKSEQFKQKAWITGFAKGMAEFITNAVFAVLFYYAGVLLSESKREFSFGNIMEAILSLMLASLGLGQALADLGDLNEAVQAAKRIFKLIDEGAEAAIDGISVNGVLNPAQHSRGEIELCDVNFCYPSRPDAKVCRDYNLKIEAGEVVALVGPSGSGKSTIMNLLLRFYDPDAGVVKLDGVDIKELNVRWLRSQIGYVGQEPVLFKGSILENIARGRADFGDKPIMTIAEVVAEAKAAAAKESDAAAASAVEDVESGLVVSGSDGGVVPEDVIQAAKASAAHDFIMSFSQGYQTDVGESSMMLSGGQKQRIAIARALIKKPAVLLLDEATSALDATSERYVQESIDALQQSKAQTIIVIAHRLTTIRNADKIAVIYRGRVVELGKHDELLSLNGLYAELWNKQVRVSSSASVDNLVTQNDN
mmetsp:Transcript_18040/g.24763  ORF Transcript_18040/g.24763 Transcript_18040/m.24763 type:complete len:1356 (+) Transcript_18040:119-4186(+)